MTPSASTAARTVSRDEIQAFQAPMAARGTALLYGAVSLLLFGPLAFGAVEPWSAFVLEIGAALLLLAWTWRQLAAGEIRIAWNPVFAPMIAFAFLLAAQLILGKSAYPRETRAITLLYCAFGTICFLLAQSAKTAVRLRTLAFVFSLYGAAIAAFAVLQSLISNGKIYWFRNPGSTAWIYGPYVNHNHYAGLMELLVPIPLVLTFGRHAQGKHRMLAACAAALMASTIFLSGSRGGMVAFLAQIAVLAFFLLRSEKRRKSTLTLAVLLLVVAGLIAWLGGAELSKRLSSIHSEARAELSQGTRLQIYRDGLRMFSDKPLLGWGLGVFPTVYPRYQGFYTNLIVNRAHNDYVQLLVETGALGFAIMLWFLAVAYRGAHSKLTGWQYDIRGAAALAGVLACSGILVHSFLDSNLQIPANALLFYAWGTMAAAQQPSHVSVRSSKGTPLAR